MVGLLFTANYNKTMAQFMYYNHTMIGLSVRENLHCHGYSACLYRSAYHFFYRLMPCIRTWLSKRCLCSTTSTLSDRLVTFVYCGQMVQDIITDRPTSSICVVLGIIVSDWSRGFLSRDFGTLVDRYFGIFRNFVGTSSVVNPRTAEPFL